MRKDNERYGLLLSSVLAACAIAASGCDKQSIGTNEAASEFAGEEGPATQSSGGATFGSDTGCIDGCGADGARELPSFDPVPDVGDGTLHSDLVMYSDVDGASFHMRLAVERLGDGFQGYVQSALQDGEEWSFGPWRWIDSRSAVNLNEVTLRIDDYPFGAGSHPFGGGSLELDVVISARIHSEDVLCGTVLLRNGGFESFSPATVAPFEWMSEDGTPEVLCSP